MADDEIKQRAAALAVQEYTKMYLRVINDLAAVMQRLNNTISVLC
jgi:hypothetical protein